MGPRELDVLFWIVLASLVAVIATTIALIRSGRAVSLPRVQRRRHPRP